MIALTVQCPFCGKPQDIEAEPEHVKQCLQYVKGIITENEMFLDVNEEDRDSLFNRISGTCYHCYMKKLVGIDETVRDDEPDDGSAPRPSAMPVAPRLVQLDVRPQDTGFTQYIVAYLEQCDRNNALAQQLSSSRI